jgi:hypothetical protein
MSIELWVRPQKYTVVNRVLDNAGNVLNFGDSENVKRVLLHIGKSYALLFVLHINC